MSFKIIVFAAAVFTCQVNSQMTGIIRPFATGFTNGLSEMAKPFVQFGQTVMAPANEFITGHRRPGISQWMSYPAQIIPQAQAQAYEGYEAIASGMPGYFQAIRPSPVFKPQPQGQAVFKPQPPVDPRPQPFEPITVQTTYLRPSRPYPAPAPASAISQESLELYQPSNLLIKPAPVEVEASAKLPEGAMTLDEKFEVPTLQKPLDISESEKNN